MADILDISGSLNGIGNGNIMLILLIGIVLLFCVIIWKGIDKKYRKIKFMVFEGGNSYAFGVRRLKENIGVIPDDLLGIMMNKPMIAQPIQKWEQQEVIRDGKVYVGHGYIYDTKGNKIYMAKQLTDGTLIPYFIYSEDDMNEVRIENYKEAGHIASEYLDLQDRIRKTAEASNPIMAILLPAIPSLLMFLVVFIGMYMIVQATLGAYTAISGDNVKVITLLNEIAGKIGAGSPAGSSSTVPSIIINPPVETVANQSADNPLSGLPQNMR